MAAWTRRSSALAKGITIDGVTSGRSRRSLEFRAGRQYLADCRLKEGKNREIRRVMDALLEPSPA